jgi:hypothetical protein
MVQITLPDGAQKRFPDDDVPDRDVVTALGDVLRRNAVVFE